MLFTNMYLQHFWKCDINHIDAKNFAVTNVSFSYLGMNTIFISPCVIANCQVENAFDTSFEKWEHQLDINRMLRLIADHLPDT